MSKRLLFLLLSLLAITTLYAAGQRQVGFIWIGNSLIKGALVDPNQSLPAQTHRLLGANCKYFANNGQTGWTIKRLYEHREELLGTYLTSFNRLRCKRIYVPLEEGLNGFGGGDVSQAEYQHYWTLLCDYINSKGGIPIVLTNTPCGDVRPYAPYYAKNKSGSRGGVVDLDASRKAFIDWQRANWQSTLHAAAFIDLNQVQGMGTVGATADSVLFHQDRTHPTAAGYRKEAVFCAPILQHLVSE